MDERLVCLVLVGMELAHESHNSKCSRELSGRLLARGQISVRSYLRLSKGATVARIPSKVHSWLWRVQTPCMTRCRYTRMTSLWAEWLVKPAQP